MNRRTDPLFSDWRQHLAALPEVDPPEALWQRLQLARSSKPAARRRWPWIGAAAAAALAALLVWPRAQAPAPDALPSLAPAVALAPSMRSDASLRRLDDELALAYSRNADEVEIAALWQTRERVIASLQDPAPALLVRM